MKRSISSKIPDSTKVVINISSRGTKYEIKLEDQDDVRKGDIVLYDMLCALYRLDLFKAGVVDRWDISRFTERMLDRTEIRNGKIEVI